MIHAQTSSARKFEVAAEGGAPDAQFHLGLLYSTGQGVERDYVTAHKWCRSAALAAPRRLSEADLAPAAFFRGGAPAKVASTVRNRY